ncbi:enoyl-CoA hydratase/isomerase [Kordia algicida OT-1]|uniref:Polyketide biosynthesis enoyl-CoA hydratase n=1 Tax=Kordia algicida OT-1 TaxID=391587 RepID=A9EAC8_9FLAO|nr:enoyl-CoA hydratase/isomerase [Kordia algicida]EDP94614.1 polyketide biosynthesis enoyl-CoA hydratase [Kordia algicida OT-1]
MDILNTTNYDTLQVKLKDEICFIQIDRPEENNTINDRLIHEFKAVLEVCETEAKIVVIEGLPEVFCFGADFKAINENTDNQEQNPEPLYDVWLQLATGSFVSIAHVRGKANAGGVGFVAACDIVLCEDKAVFSLSELLFGLMPACVLPFLIRRMGFAKANYLTIMTQPVNAQQALEWGLVDACEENSKNLLRKHLLRLRRLNKAGVARYKKYMNKLDSLPENSKSDAIAANIEVFSDEENVNKIKRFVNTGQFPWE